MSNKAISWAWDQGLEPREKLVLICLADAASDEDWQCWPSQRHIANKTGYSIATIKRALKRLEEIGTLKRAHRLRRDGTRTSDVYTLAVSRAQPDTTVQPDTTPVHPDTGGGYPVDRGTRSRLTYQEPSLEPSLEPSSGASAAAPNAQTLIAEWVDAYDGTPPKSVLGQLARQIKNLLDEGNDYTRVRAAVMAWHERGLHPSVLPSILHEMNVRRAASTKPKVIGRMEF